MLMRMVRWGRGLPDLFLPSAELLDRNSYRANSHNQLLALSDQLHSAHKVEEYAPWASSLSSSLNSNMLSHHNVTVTSIPR
jgi:hypothetical protein